MLTDPISPSPIHVSLSSIPHQAQDAQLAARVATAATAIACSPAPLPPPLTLDPGCFSSRRGSPSCPTPEEVISPAARHRSHPTFASAGSHLFFLRPRRRATRNNPPRSSIHRLPPASSERYDACRRGDGRRMCEPCIPGARSRLGKQGQGGDGETE